jgi:hypothetical protein
MTVLTRFPSRIRFVNPDGTLTPEAARMLDAMVTRVGGGLGDQGVDMFAAPSTGEGPAFGPDIAGVASPEQHLAPPILGVASPEGHAAVEVAGIASPESHMAPIDLQPPSAQAGFTEMTFQGSGS